MLKYRILFPFVYEVFFPFGSGFQNSVAKGLKFRSQISKGAETNCVGSGKSGVELLADQSNFFVAGFALKQSYFRLNIVTFH
jgi:hypothetical protein